MAEAELDRGIIEQFIAVTGTDEELAKYYLMENNNSVARAIDMFYANESVITIEDDSDVDVTLGAQDQSLPQGDPNQSVILIDDPVTPQPVRTSSSPLEPSLPQPETTNCSLKLICWNIQGLEERLLRERTVAAISVLKRESPDVVFLQEVVPVTLSMMEEKLKPTYHIFPGGRSAYFAAMLLKRADFQLETVMVEPFPRSRMLRNLIIAKAKFHGVSLKLMTSHIESMASHSEERKSQLRTTFAQMKNIDAATVSIFGADTNAKDAEIGSLQGDLTDIQDVWEVLGSSNETKYTWDMLQNDNLGFRGPRIRYDRLYFHQKGDRLQPVKLELVGKERLGCGMFISDHWGIMASFNLKNVFPAGDVT